MNRLFLLLAGAALSANVCGQRALPACRVADADTLCRIFVYSPGSKDGLHLAYLDADDKWTDVGQLCASDYSRWGSEKRMYDPCVVRATDGTWRAVWSLNDYAPCFAAAYSADLLTWRPQDYPKVSVKGVQRPLVRQAADGSFDIRLSSASGPVHVRASNDFRSFAEQPASAAAADKPWAPDTATVGPKRFEGNLFDVPKRHLDRIFSHFDALAADAEKSRVTMRDDADRFSDLPATVAATLTVDPSRTKAISDKLVGVFFEDISYAADGGLYAELVQNRDFEYSPRDRKEWGALTAWEHSGGVRVETERPLSPANPHYVVMRADTLSNLGWDGIADRGAAYDFSVQARTTAGGSKQLTVALIADDGTVAAQGRLKVSGSDWKRYSLQLNTARPSADEVRNCRLTIVGHKDAEVALDMISLFPHDTYKGHGLRRDLAEAIAALRPKFVRFPGGCMSHGDGLDNIYHWNHTVGPWHERIPDRNIWRYHQTRGLGFYEYFQFCEDIGAEPLPVLAAGVPCQNSGPDSEGFGGQQGGIPMDDMPAYCQEILDMIEWANGDPAQSKWARMRADAGHPEPFNLKYVGIGNEDIISTVFEERCLMICKAIKEKYPDIVVCGTVGPFHDPSADYIEGWRFAKEHSQYIDMVDEHYYESPGWFLSHQDYYDSYDRSAPKVYLGEWASRTRTMESALVEAMHLCHIEKNADVVVMTSYAPLLCKDRHHNWNPDMIYFDNVGLTLTPSYHTQKLFSVGSGDTYVSTELSVPAGLENRVAASLVADSKSGRRFLKLVNALPSALKLDVSGIAVDAGARVEGFRGLPADKAVRPADDARIEGSSILLPPYSVVCVEL